MSCHIFQGEVLAGARDLGLLRGLPAEALARVSEFVTIAATVAMALDRTKTGTLDFAENTSDHEHAGENDSLADYQHFANVVAGEKELDGREVAKQILDVTIIEDPLQRKGCRRIPMLAMVPLRVQRVHFEYIGAGNMVAVIWRVGTSLASMKEREQHSARLHHRP